MSVLNNISWEEAARILTIYHIKELCIAALLTILTRVLLQFIHRQSSKLSDRASRSKTFTSGIRIKRFQIISAEQAVRYAHVFINGLTLFVYCLVLLTYLNIIFGLFEATKFLNHAVTGFFISTLQNAWGAFTGYLPNLFSILMISIFGFYFLSLSKLIFTAIQNGELKFKNFHKEWAKPTFQILQFITISLLAVMIFPLLPGFDSPAFQGIGVFLGLLISLGSTGIVSNIIAGIMIIYMRSFKIGDRVSANNIIGDIVEQTLLVTKIRTIENEEISIPNAILLSSPITNYSKESESLGLILTTSITIGYDAPWRTVHELLIAAAKATPGVLHEPEAHVFQKSLDDFYVCYQLRAYTNQPNRMAMIYSDLHQNIQDQFNGAGVEIMSPHYRAHREGPVTIPHT